MTTSTIVMPFGKYKDTAITELKPSYVNWLLANCTLPDDLRVDLEALVADSERAFQRRKALAIGLQSSHISLHERRAYKKRMGWVGA
jgi:hypothetical protein